MKWKSSRPGRPTSMFRFALMSAISKSRWLSTWGWPPVDRSIQILQGSLTKSSDNAGWHAKCVSSHFFFRAPPSLGSLEKSCGSVTTRLKSGMRATQSNAERHLPSAGAAHTSGRLWNHWWFWENPLIATFFHWIFWMFIHWTPATWLLGDVWVFFYFFVKCANRRHDL